MNGRDLRELRQESWRREVAVVFQDNVLFNMSLRENIRLGRLEASNAEVEAAARAAEVHEFIATLPDGRDPGRRAGQPSLWRPAAAHCDRARAGA